MHVRAVSKSPCMFLEGTRVPTCVPQEGPMSSTHVPCIPCDRYVPPPCPVVPPGCHRLIRAVSVSSHGSLVRGFHGKVTAGLG